MYKRYIIVSICVLLLIFSMYACSTSRNPYGTYTSDSGGYQLELNDDGTFTFLSKGKVESKGTFSLNGNEITWDTDSFCDLQGNGKSTYTWTLKDDTLVMTVQGEDKCSDRQTVIDQFPYHIEK